MAYPRRDLAGGGTASHGLSPAGRTSLLQAKCSEYTSGMEGASPGGSAMNYCILRTEKLSTFGAVSSSAKHTFREIPTPNADAKRTHLNKTIGADSALKVREAVKARLPVKRRKDAVLCIEYLITASPEWFDTATKDQKNKYFKDAINWLYARHGKENCVCLNLQLDEKSPHLVAYVVPITKDGRLSAKEFLGGPAKLSKMQSDFAEQVGKGVGLQRGVEGSKADHLTAKQYNAALKKNPLLEPPKPPAPTLTDRLTGKAKQQEEKHKAEAAAYAATLQRARNEAMAAKKAREQQAQALAKHREEVAELKTTKAEAARLRKENQQLQEKITEQKKFFEKMVDGLKAQLVEAQQTIERLFDQVDSLKEYIKKIVPNFGRKPAPRPGRMGDDDAMTMK